MICTTPDPLFSLILIQPHLPSAIVLSQGLCACRSRCLNHFPSDSFMALSAYFLQIFTKNISSSVGTSLATLIKQPARPPSTQTHSLPCLSLSFSTYHHFIRSVFCLTMSCSLFYFPFQKEPLPGQSFLLPTPLPHPLLGSQHLL